MDSVLRLLGHITKHTYLIIYPFRLYSKDHDIQDNIDLAKKFLTLAMQ